jgi:hypothetical protein
MVVVGGRSLWNAIMVSAAMVLPGRRYGRELQHLGDLGSDVNQESSNAFVAVNPPQRRL